LGVQAHRKLSDEQECQALSPSHGTPPLTLCPVP
jgi:hypothetical protein